MYACMYVSSFRQREVLESLDFIGLSCDAVSVYKVLHQLLIDSGGKKKPLKQPKKEGKELDEVTAFRIPHAHRVRMTLRSSRSRRRRQPS